MTSLLSCFTALAVLFVCAGCGSAEQDQPLDLGGATIVSSHETYDAHGDTSAPLIADGDEETSWSSSTGDVSVSPANILITFPEPVTVGQLEVLTVESKGWIRVTHLEVYAGVDGGWAPLGAVTHNHEERFTIELTPITLTTLRLRVRGNERPDNQFAVIREVALAAAAEADAVKLDAEPVPDQSVAEEIAIATLCGDMIDLIPETTWDPQRGYLWYARSFMDTMIEHGTDRYGAVHSPMFTSILDMRTKTHPGGALLPIVGQRHHDRAVMGGNLQHDVPLLIAMERMSELTGEDRYQEAAHDYLQFFLDNCGTPTGLWPWGEHAHWDFYAEKVGHSDHEHLGLPPAGFYELAWEINSQAVIGEADGCINHVVNLQTFDFNRHANVLEPLPEPRPQPGSWLDFSRHGAMYAYEWAFAYSKTGDEKYLAWINGMLDHFESNRRPDGIRMATPERNLTEWSLSVTLTLMEGAPLAGDTETARRMARLADEYLQAQMSQPRYDTEKLQETIVNRPPGFNHGYGYGDFSSVNNWLLAYRLTGEERCLDIARVTVAYYRDVPEVPADRELRAIVFGQLIEMMLDMYEFDGDAGWLAAAERYAQQAVSRLYYDGLFRGGTGLWYYDSELYVSSLIHALVRLASVTDETAATVPALYFHR